VQAALERFGPDGGSSAVHLYEAGAATRPRFFVETGERCGGIAEIVAATEGPEAIATILEHPGSLLPLEAPQSAGRSGASVWPRNATSRV
jgi:hypothetical protein